MELIVFTIILAFRTRNSLLLVIFNLIVLSTINFILIEPRNFNNRILVNIIELDFTRYFIKVTIELIMLFSFIASYGELLNRKKSMLFSLITIMNIIILFLIYSRSQIIFYILFEISVIPIFLIITG
jgi:NADH:ubiquinone oxidoreductase subunit 4 (subunit M)